MHGTETHTHARKGVRAHAAKGKRKRGECKRERRQVGKRTAGERNWENELACISIQHLKDI